MSIDILVCSCGMRLKTPGAVPGRVGKCPRCGSLLKVPEPSTEIPVERPIASPTFVDRRAKKRSKTGLPGHTGGLVAGPRSIETRWQESLLYPLWGDPGISILAFMSVSLWFATIPMFLLVPTFTAGTALSLIALALLIPFLIVLAYLGGHILGFLGQVLVTSAIGELSQPRPASWSLSEVGSTLGRWFWAALIGVVIGGAPTMVYWINCGEVDWLDRFVMLDLVIPGLAYAQMALLATLIHESPLAANPLTVLQAIGRVGWSYFWPCVRTGSVLIVIGLLFEGVMWIKDGLIQAIAFWVFWVFFLYASMVVLRWLGLFCLRNAVPLGWFPEAAERFHDDGLEES